MMMQIYKGSGDTGKCTNYRGITIISVLSKIYAILLNTVWPLPGWRPRLGGREGRPASLQITAPRIMQRFIDKYRLRNKSFVRLLCGPEQSIGHHEQTKFGNDCQIWGYEAACWQHSKLTILMYENA